MKRVILIMVGAILGLAVAGMPLNARSAKKDIPYPEIPRMTLNEVKKLLGRPGVILLDCRPVEQWKDSDSKLPGAVHEDPTDVKSWAHKYPKDSTIIIY